MMSTAKEELLIELEEHKSRAQKVSDAFVNFVDSSGVKEQFRWLMAINSGVLIWLISSLDKFSINNALFWKKFYILIIALQMISVVMFFYFNGILFMVTMQAKLLLIEVKSWKDGPIENLDKLIQQMEELEKKLPQPKTVIFVEIAFALSFVFLTIYIISFIIGNK